MRLGQQVSRRRWMRAGPSMTMFAGPSFHNQHELYFPIQDAFGWTDAALKFSMMAKFQ